MRRTLVVLAVLVLAACADRRIETTPGNLAAAAAGYALGGRLLPSDQAAYDHTLRRALAEARDSEIRRWDNAQTGHRGIFCDVRSFRVGAGGLDCRDDRSRVVVEDGPLPGAGTACRMADGRWAMFGRDSG